MLSSRGCNYTKQRLPGMGFVPMFQGDRTVQKEESALPFVF